MMEVKLDEYRKYTYHSFQYIDVEDLKGTIEIESTNQVSIRYKDELKRIHVYWATDNVESLLSGLDKIKSQYPEKGLYLEFVPEVFVAELENHGYKIYSEFADFWNLELPDQELVIKNGIEIREINADELQIASDITKACKGQSRGFDGESLEDITEWYEDEHSKIFVASIGGEITGILMTSLYGFDNPEKLTVWIRLLAVAPLHQRKGIGQALLSKGLSWGASNNARRSFLHADVHNDGAINMYRRNGFNMSDQRGQINMILD